MNSLTATTGNSMKGCKHTMLNQLSSGAVEQIVDAETYTGVDCEFLKALHIKRQSMVTRAYERRFA